MQAEALKKALENVIEPQEIRAEKRCLIQSHLISNMIKQRKSNLCEISVVMPNNEKDLESKIKQAERWLNGKYVNQELAYQPYIIPLLKTLCNTKEIILVMDGSGFCKQCNGLMVSIKYKKRAVPLCWVVRKGEKGHFPSDMHVELLERTKSLLPKGNYRVVFLGDGEFDSKALIQKLQEYGWEYVLRTSLDRTICDSTGEKFPIRH